MVPNIFHFIFLTPSTGGKPFSLSHYLAIQSAITENNPSDVILHYDNEPSGEFWELIKPKVSLNKIQPPSNIHGNPLYHLAHKADIIRLEALQKTGGIYLDVDTITVKPLTEFRKYKFAIGQELKLPVEYTFKQKIKKLIRHTTVRPFKVNVGGFCNAVLFSEPNSEFIEHWLASYKNFRSKGNDEFWNEHSVQKPFELSKNYPTLVEKVSPYAFHYPLFDECGLKMLFEESRRFKDAYVHHLWEAASWDKYLKHLTVTNIKSVDTTYNNLARKYL
jgi:hypothetical protein